MYVKVNWIGRYWRRKIVRANQPANRSVNSKVCQRVSNLFCIFTQCQLIKQWNDASRLFAQPFPPADTMSQIFARTALAIPAVVICYWRDIFTGRWTIDVLEFLIERVLLESTVRHVIFLRCIRIVVCGDSALLLACRLERVGVSLLGYLLYFLPI